MNFTDFKKITSLLFHCSLMILLLVSCNSENDDINTQVNEVNLTTLKGKYVGTWNSTTPSITYTDYPISLKINHVNQDETIINGEFFATSSFTSCCNSGENDGSISMQIKDNSIVSFNYTDIIPECAGSFKGSGSIGNELTLSINFAGNDCDGDHVGTLLFKKIE